jgi:uncharacterized protein (DUF1330 family)
MEGAVPIAYWIARVDVSNPEILKAYVPGVARAFAARGAKLPEREARARNGVKEFSSYPAAAGCYTSFAFQAARIHRVPAAPPEIVILEGVEPQDQEG